jgi:hypothetical protein
VELFVTVSSILLLVDANGSLYTVCENADSETISTAANIDNKYFVFILNLFIIIVAK